MKITKVKCYIKGVGPTVIFGVKLEGDWEISSIEEKEKEKLKDDICDLLFQNTKFLSKLDHATRCRHRVHRSTTDITLLPKFLPTPSNSKDWGTILIEDGKADMSISRC